jgi:DNA mismatch endonuclease (patch repair protein)
VRIRFKRTNRKVAGQPDLVIFGSKVAVFCDGDFWHGRHWRQRRAALASGHNAEYWIKKIGRNIQRDREVNRELRASGWVVVRLWESDIRRDPSRAAEEIVAALPARRVPKDR